MNPHCFPVERDNAYIERLVAEELEFWNKVQHPR